jgi:tRNA-modifying protein YgfZ
MENSLHQIHESLGASFTTVNGVEAVGDYGEVAAEYGALRSSAGILDLSFRSRLCLTGSDRVRFLHGQVTNDIKRLKPGEGCYAALVTAKGRMESDLNVYILADELLLDFEPGLTGKISQRLERFIVADDVQALDVSPLYGLLSVQGSRAEEVLRHAGLGIGSGGPTPSTGASLPSREFGSIKIEDPSFGEIYVMNQLRFSEAGFDLFVPVATQGSLFKRLASAAKAVGGRACGQDAAEVARLEAGRARFGVDMDETNFPQECGIESRAVSYSKGCYVGQEVLNRIHTMGHVNRQLCGFRLPDDLQNLPIKGERLFANGKEAGHITSAVRSPGLKGNIALGCVRNEFGSAGNELVLKNAAGEIPVRVVALPFNVPR